MKTKAIILKCKPLTQFHIGKYGLDDNMSLADSSNWIHSDTLFSAIICTIARIYPQEVIDNFIKLFENQTISVSSIFYCLEKNKDAMIYFLPKPISYNLTTTSDNRKQVKKIKFISKAVWEKGYQPEDWVNDAKCQIIQKQFVCTVEEFEGMEKDVKIYYKHTLPKVAVHKATKEDTLYNQTNIQVAQNQTTPVHLFFLLKTTLSKEDEQYKKLSTVIRLLADTGIGGERSTGCGLIDTITTKNFNVELAEETHTHCSIGLFVPKNQIELQHCTHYQVVRRAGRKTSHDGILQRIRMIQEGAIMTSDQLEGTIVDISPNNDNTYSRYGSFMSLPLPSKSTKP